MVAITIASTHYTYPGRDGQAELSWVARLNTMTVYPRTVTHLSTNLARRRITSLMRPTMLPLSQTATSRSSRSLHSIAVKFIVSKCSEVVMVEVFPSHLAYRLIFSPQLDTSLYQQNHRYVTRCVLTHLSPVFIVCTLGGMARLSCPRWMVTVPSPKLPTFFNF